MKSVRISTLSLATFLSAVGCGGPNPSSPNGPGGSASSDASASETSPSDTSGMSEPSPLSIRGITHGADGSTLSGVTVCLERGITIAAVPINSVMCTLSAADGSFAVSGALPNADTMLTFRKNDFAPTLRAIATQTSDITLPANENVLLPNPLSFLGVPANSEKGQIAFAATTAGTGPAENLSVTAERLDLLGGYASAPEQPVYLDRDGSPASRATSGTRGGFVNVTPGLYVVRFHYATGTCSASTGLYGYPMSNDPPWIVTLLVPVDPGYVSAPVGVSCTGGP
jgi:hypothetical protein